jgi:hypothetical protein
MARVNITVPDEVLAKAQAAGLIVSRVASAALVAELERLSRIAALDAYLAELDAELGPIPQQEAAEAKAWLDRVVTTGAVSVAGGRRPSAPKRVKKRSA